MKVSAASAGLRAAVHAARGGAATLAAVALFANAVKNRNALACLLLLRWRAAVSAIRVELPSRTLTAAAVFVAAYRFLQRLETLFKRRLLCHEPVAPLPATSDDSAIGNSSPQAPIASITASMASVLCIDPSNRAAINSLLSAKTASLALQSHVQKHPEHAHLAALEVLAFVATGGWIMYSAFFASDSYAPTHFRTIMKYTLVDPSAVARIQHEYRRGLNPRTCTMRHPGRTCTEYLFPEFAKRVVSTAARLYLPAHLTSWLLALRHPAVRAAPRRELLAKFVARFSRSMAYFIGFIGVSMSATCYSNAIGDRSLVWRKFQLALCGSLPGLAILFEPPARRSPIVVIVGSYALLSACAVASSRWPLRALRSGPTRTLVDIALFAGTVSYTLPEMLRGNWLLRRLLLGGRTRRTEIEREGC